MAAERDVIYRLKVMYDQSGSQAFALMNSQNAAAIKAMEERWKAFDAAMKAAAESQTQASGRSYSKQKDHAKEYYDYVAAENRKLAAAIKEREKAEEMARRTQERAFAQTKAGNAMMREGLMNTAEGVTRVVRGLTLMGFVSDQNLEKLLKTLAAVQGTSDVILGSVKAYSALQKAVDGYTMAVQAARTAEAARAGVSGAGAAAGGAGAAGGVGLGGLAIGGVAAAAAIASVSLALAELSEIASGTAGETGSLTATIGRFMERTGDWIRGGRKGPDQDYTNAYENEQATKRFQRRFNAGRQNLGRIENEAANFSGLESAREANRRRQVAAGMGFDPFGNEGAFFGGAGGRYNAEIERQRGRAGGYAASVAGVNPEDTAARPEAIRNYDKAVDAENEILRLKKEQAEYQLKISQSSQAYHSAAVTAAQQELDILRQQQSAAGDRLESARDRFGMMSPMEQQRALRLGKLANQANELRSSGRTDEARRIENQFTRDDLGVIRGIGTEGTDAFGGRVAGDRADRSGFSGVFGNEERKRASEINTRIESLVAEKQLNFEASIKLEINDEQIKRVLEGALKQGEDRIRKLADEVAGLRSKQELYQRNNALGLPTATRAN